MKVTTTKKAKGRLKLCCITPILREVFRISQFDRMFEIYDDEPRIFINNVSAQQGTSGTTPFTFTVSLSSTYDLPVTVNYTTADGSAKAGTDYSEAQNTDINGIFQCKTQSLLRRHEGTKKCYSPFKNISGAP